MKKVGLLVVGLLCLSVVVHAGEAITNGTGEDATGLRVTFSEPVLITGFGDILTSVDPQMLAFEFVFTGGIVEPWGSHWMNWAPATAQIIEHEWLVSDSSSYAGAGSVLSGVANFQDSPLILPTATTTCFPLLNEGTAAVELPPLEFSSIFLHDYEDDDTIAVQAIDGFSPGSTAPLDWWYTYSVADGQYTFTRLTPEGNEPVTYRYPEDGSVGYCTLSYREPVDLSSCAGIQIVASADHPADIYVTLAICDDAVPAEEDEPCGGSCVSYSIPIHVTEEPQVFVLPSSGFAISDWLLDSDPPVTMTPRFYGVTEVMFDPDDDAGVLEIHEVSSLTQIVPIQATEPEINTQIIPIQATAPEINDYYFQHPAYVMQGVGDLDSVYALPLEGIPELGTGYVATDSDSEQLMWSVSTSTSGISAGFQDDTLYIWGSNASWSGYGDVTLSVSDEDGETDSITIPVTVFRQDKTLINNEDKTAYFVPWSPQLDINRIASLERFLLLQDERDSQLDRSINFSRFVLVEYMKSVTFNENWTDDSEFGWRWSWNSMQTLIDYRIDELAAAGVNWIFWRDPMFMLSRSSNELIRIYGFDEIDYSYGGWRRSTPKRALDYIVNRAHSKGMKVAIGNFLQDIDFGRGDILPSDWDTWWANYASLSVEEAVWAANRGIDLYVVGESLCMPWTLPGPELAERFRVVIEAVREVYAGPIAYLDRLISQVDNASPADWETQYGNIWAYVDFLSDNPWRSGMFPDPDPSLEFIVSEIRKYMDSLVVPLVEEYRKPMIFFESHMVSANEMISRFGEFVAGTYLGLRPDWELQEKWYLGVFEAMSIYDWFYGHGWYGQDFNGPYYDRGTGPSFRNKLAEDVVRIYYGDGTLPNRAVALNGVPDEWADADLVWERLDSLEPVDRGKLLRISSRQDGLGLFLLIELEGNLVPYFPRHDGITMHITVNDDTEQEYTCRIYHGRFDWVGTLVSTTDPFEYVGFVDVAQDPTNTIFELGIPLHLLDFPSSTLIRVETVTHGTRVNAWLEETHEGELLDQMEAPIEITLNVNS